MNKYRVLSADCFSENYVKYGFFTIFSGAVSLFLLCQRSQIHNSRTQQTWDIQWGHRRDICHRGSGERRPSVKSMPEKLLNLRQISLALWEQSSASHDRTWIDNWAFYYFFFLTKMEDWKVNCRCLPEGSWKSNHTAHIRQVTLEIRHSCLRS